MSNTSKLSEVLQSGRAELLAQWMKEQLSSDALRSDLLSEAELQRESSNFLNALTEASGSLGSEDVEAASFKPVLGMLENLSRTRGRQGFTPRETVNFIFSLKAPLYSALKAKHGANAQSLADDVLKVSALLDKLGLHTMATYMETREKVIRGQQADMLELSTPVVQLWDGIVALPLIGTLDSNRTSIVMETLLEEIVKTRSEIAIVDITGVPTVDTQVAQHLLKTVAAARLMGADCIISGIRPQIAQTMVHLQIDLGNVTTKATMAEALKTALKRNGYVVGKKAPPAAAPSQS